MSSPREQLHCSRKGCKYTTNRSYNLDRHERNHEKGKVPVSQCQPCPHCDYAAGSLHNLTRHISKKHVLLSPVKKEKEKETENGKLVSAEPKKEKEQKEEKEEKKEEKQELPQTTEQPLKATIKSSPKREKLEKPAKQALKTEELQQQTSLWDWSTLQQQEKNFLRRWDSQAECKIHKQTVNLFKLYSLVRARGGALNVDAWDDVASAVGIATKSAGGRQVRAKYLELLMEFEKSEEQRLQDCMDLEGVPTWWDDGDFVATNRDCKP
ncbi:hypothetical protein KR044_003795, partial [Drosophila immigrans]